MNRMQREELIERYLAGAMTPVEEERFLIEVASDPELRHDLKASQVIDSAIRKDRSLGAVPTGRMRAEIAALLVPAGSLSQGSEESVPTAGSGILGSWGAGLLTGVLGLVLIYGVVEFYGIDRSGTSRLERFEVPTAEQVLPDPVEIPILGLPATHNTDIESGTRGEGQPRLRSAAGSERPAVTNRRSDPLGRNDAATTTDARSLPSFEEPAAPTLDAEVPSFDPSVTLVPETEMRPLELSTSDTSNPSGTMPLQLDD